jgi:hypothetical protein
MHIPSIGIPTRLLLCVALLMTAVPSGAGAQEEDHAITVCICQTVVRQVPIYWFGVRVGTTTITETQCWYEPG